MYNQTTIDARDAPKLYLTCYAVLTFIVLLLVGYSSIKFDFIQKEKRQKSSIHLYVQMWFENPAISFGWVNIRFTFWVKNVYFVLVGNAYTTIPR
jgi:hypothetical protein